MSDYRQRGIACQLTDRPPLQGQDGVKIWEVETKKEVTVPLQPFQERSQVSCVRWITRKNENMDVLCYGNALGYLIFLQHRLGEVGLIDDESDDAHHVNF